jgi:hypothetical protein
MSKLLVVFLTIITVLIPFVARADQSSSAGMAAPIEQPLVREGDFAVKLASSLNLTSSSTEAQAESSLASVGIAPRNGWIADYPVTPDIVAELRNAAGEAADSGRLALAREQAVSTVQGVSTDMGLSVSGAGRQTGYASSGSSSQNYDPDAVQNYYYDSGPPIVTYYAPPWDYAYLYSWVPCDFWWGDYPFGGFFILNDFDRVIHHHHHHDGEVVRITNQVRTAGGEVRRIDPANRLAMSGSAGSPSNTHVTGLSSSEARLGARSIVSHDMDRSEGNVSAGHSGSRNSYSAAPRVTQPKPTEGFSNNTGFTPSRSYDGQVAHNSISSEGFHGGSGAFHGGGFQGGSSGGFHGGGGGARR